MKQLLPRRKPETVPALQPVPEYDATGTLAKTYEDTKQVLQVPWMGVVTMSFAQYPGFWNVLWKGLRPLAQSAEFANACKRLRAVAESGAAEMQAADLIDSMTEGGYGAREIAEIRATIEVFSHGNMAYLLIATAARMLLDGHELAPLREVTAQRGNRAPPAPSRLVLMEPHHADAATQRVYADIRQTLGLPFVNTDYRALARWPSYFRLAWNELKPMIASVDHLAAVEMVHREAVNLVRNLPNPGGLTPDMVMLAAERDATADEVRAVVQLFQWLLPELVVNVAVLRAQLGH